MAKAAYWNDLLQKLVAPLNFAPARRTEFDAQFCMDAIGPLSIRRTLSMPATLESTPRHIATVSEQRFYLMMPVDTRVSISHCGQYTILGPGDFVLIDGTAPSRVEFNEPNTSLHLVFHPQDLRSRLPTPENLCGVKGSSTGPFGRVVASMLEDVWRQVESGFPQEFGLTVAKNLLDVVSTAYALQHGKRFGESVSISERRAHIKRFIEARLRDPELTPAYIADYFGVSTRYVGMIFEREEEPISAYIARRRLEECAHQLGSSTWASRSVTEIAREWGFGNRAHFSRVFKKRFGASPREYRRMHLSGS
ncbi:MAG TPA: helix-turn-helix domain-containing protein [Gammaproteobacteria bacterium]|nr:helix-turn-helix domain-containing protein [Gammaproteobacteria bacterium]